MEDKSKMTPNDRKEAEAVEKAQEIYRADIAVKLKTLDVLVKNLKNGLVDTTGINHSYTLSIIEKMFANFKEEVAKLIA